MAETGRGVESSKTKSKPKVVTWTQILADSAPRSRSSHTIASIGNEVFVFGGEDAPRHVFDSDIYSCVFSTGSPVSVWKRLNIHGSSEKPSPVLGHTMVSVGHKLYLFGGRFGGKDDEEKDNSELYVFDTKSLNWKKLTPANGDIPAPRSYHAMTSVDDKIYVFGGLSYHVRVNDLWCFDVENNTWIKLPVGNSHPPVARGGSSLIGLKGSSGNHLLYLIYGFVGKPLDDLYVYDTDKKEWKEIKGRGDVPCPRSVFAADRIDNDRIFLFGGEVEESDQGHAGAGEFQNDSYILDTKTHAWQKLENGGKSVPSKRGWLEGTYLPEEKIFVMFGGLDSSNTRLGDAWYCCLE